MLFRYLLAVVEERVVKVRGENNGGCIYRSGKATPAGFITTGFN